MNDVTTETPKRYQCRHIFTDGHRCGSPCLHNEDFCYYHHNTRKPAQNPRQRKARRGTLQLPLPEDRSAIQTSIGLVLQAIATNDLDPRRAGILLYGLQIASTNLPKEQRSEEGGRLPHESIVEEVVLHPELGALAPQAEQPHPRRTTREQLIDWQEQQQRRLQTELDKRKRELDERESRIRAVEKQQSEAPSSLPSTGPLTKSVCTTEPAVLPEIKAAAACRRTRLSQPAVFVHSGWRPRKSKPNFPIMKTLRKKNPRGYLLIQTPATRSNDKIEGETND